MNRLLAPHRLGLAVAAYTTLLIGHTLAGVYWHVASFAYRVRQFRPVCTTLGHAFDVDLDVCVRCGTTYNRVRDCRRTM